MKQSFPLSIPLSIFSALFLLLNSCAPVFSELQSARTVGKGNIEATGSYSTVSISNDGERNHAQDHFGLQLAYGISDKIDLRARYEYIWGEADVTANVFGIGPKFSIVKDRLAGYLPLGFAFGGSIEESSKTWQIQPTIIATFPVVDFLDINPSFKVLFPFAKDTETSIALNLGLGFKLSNKFTIRPEYGILFSPGDEGSFGQFSIGMTITPKG